MLQAGEPASSLTVDPPDGRVSLADLTGSTVVVKAAAAAG